MKVIDSLWFTNLDGCIGIIVIEEDITGDRKAYIGPASGEDEKADTEKILAWGNKFSIDTAERILHFLKKEDKKEEAKWEARKRVAELITEFSRCRQERKVRDCEECGLLYHNFADCPLKPQHDEYRGFEMSGLVDIKEAESILPPEVAEELGRKQ